MTIRFVIRHRCVIWFQYLRCDGWERFDQFCQYRGFCRQSCGPRWNSSPRLLATRNISRDVCILALAWHDPCASSLTEPNSLFSTSNWCTDILPYSFEDNDKNGGIPFFLDFRSTGRHLRLRLRFPDSFRYHMVRVILGNEPRSCTDDTDNAEACQDSRDRGTPFRLKRRQLSRRFKARSNVNLPGS